MAEVASRVCPKGAQMEPQGAQMEPQGGQMEPQGGQKEPQGAQMEPKDPPRALKVSPKVPNKAASRSTLENCLARGENLRWMPPRYLPDASQMSPR